MATNSSSQISYLVLDSLSSGSKYGLEIIEYISQKTGGNYILKKPSLYSCLTRMEKKGLVSSSYWGESDLGGKRHYYTITNDGKRELEQLATEYKSSNFEIAFEENPKTETETQPQENKPVFLQQDNLFDMVKPAQKQEEKVETENEMVENQMDIFSFQASLPKEEKFEETEISTQSPASDEIIQENTEQTATSDDGKFLDEAERLTDIQEAQNQRLYDSLNDLKKYRKRKSFSENQLEMAMVYENEDEKEIQRSRIEQLKQSMLNARQNNLEQTVSTETFQPKTYQPATEQPAVQSYTPREIVSQESNAQEENKDDAVFITNRLEPAEIPIQKKISPTNIEVNIFDDNLPAPKRNSNLEPTYKDMMAKLFERKKEKVEIVEPEIKPTTFVEEQSSQTFSDYSNLKKYYSNHGIEFKEYRKSNVKRHHNTNFLDFIRASILFLLSGIGSSILFACLSAAGLLKAETNFAFYTLPIMFFVYLVYSFIKFKAFASKKQTLTYNSIVNWAIAILTTVIVLVVNIFCGMQYETIFEFSTTLLVPIFAILLVFPINYYIKKFLYKKYGK